jgi:hypothetical protein
MLTHRRLAGALLATFLLVALTGCIGGTTEGDATVYRYESWVGPLTAFFGLVAIAVGWILSEYDKRLGYGLLILPPVLMLLFVPSFFLDHVKVDDDHVEMHSGWWWEPTRTNLRFADVKQMDYFEEEKRGHRPGLHYNFYLDCEMHSGQHVRIDLDAIGFEAVETILSKAGAQGVTVPSLDEEGPGVSPH